MNLNEAFKELEILEEDTFNIQDSKDVEELGSLLNDDDTNEVVNIIDADAMEKNDLENSYAGKVILECDVCHSLCYKEPEEVVIEEDTVIDIECPYCYSSDGFKVIGKVCSFDDCNKDDEDDTDNLENDDDEKSEENKDETADESIKESVTVNTDDVIINDNGSVEVPDDSETSDDNITEENSETVEPLTDKDVEEFEDKDAKEVEEKELEEFDESLINKTVNKYLKRVYENINKFEILEVKGNDKKLVLEGLLTFNSGKTKKTRFTFAPHTITKSGKVKFIGENLDISRGKKTFEITGSIKDKVFMTESLNYNYRSKFNDKSIKIQGRVNSK